jgi:DNA-binding NtrC family response regulator
MIASRTILYVHDPHWDECVLSQALAAAGYRVVGAHSAHHAVLLSVSPSVDAVLIHRTEDNGGYSIAEKLKYLKPDLPVVLISAASESNGALPPGVDAATYSGTPDAAVHALTVFLSPSAAQRAQREHRGRP